MIHSICGLASLSINNNTASVIISKIIIIPYMETTKSFWEEIKTFDEQYIRHRHHLMWYRRLVLMLLCCEMYFLLKAVKRLLELQATAFHLKWYNLEACEYFHIWIAITCFQLLWVRLTQSIMYNIWCKISN